MLIVIIRQHFKNIRQIISNTPLFEYYLIGSFTTPKKALPGSVTLYPTPAEITNDRTLIYSQFINSLIFSIFYHFTYSFFSIDFPPKIKEFLRNLPRRFL
jgi:predicted secreted protein